MARYKGPLSNAMTFADWNIRHVGIMVLAKLMCEAAKLHVP